MTPRERLANEIRAAIAWLETLAVEVDAPTYGADDALRDVEAIEYGDMPSVRGALIDYADEVEEVAP